jgi:hypothetical protein
MRKILAGGAGVAALAAAAPASAQYGYPAYGYGHNPYAANVTAVAAQQCTAAVQNRLYTRRGVAGIIGSLLGAYGTTPRVLSITQVVPRRNTVTVRGLATSGRAAYSPYGMGAYGAVGYAYQPDLRFSCSVDYRGYVRDVDINRR